MRYTMRFSHKLFLELNGTIISRCRADYGIFVLGLFDRYYFGSETFCRL